MKTLTHLLTVRTFIILLVTAVLGPITELYAQEGILKGKIIDQNGLALPGATIRLESDATKGAIADVEGNYFLLNIPVGEQNLIVSSLGSITITQPLIIKPGTNQANFKLEPGYLVAQEVVVLGDRMQGQAKALSAQKSNANITNIVSSDQIGRFPDANIGDAMKRIPGITVQYDQGEARFGLIRGTSPALNSVTINGERVPSAEAESRTVQLDLIPADMIQTIEVNKSITPDMDADAIGGSVNLVTRSAPSGFRVSGTLAGGYGMLREKPVYSGGLIIGNRFFEDKIGLIVSTSYHSNIFGSDNLESAWEKDEDSNKEYLSELEVRRYDIQRIRRSVSAALDYQINSNHTIFLKWIYNHRDDWENRYRLGLSDLSVPDEEGNVEEMSIERELKAGGDARGKNARLEDQRTRNLSLSGEHLFGDKVKLNWSGTLARASEDRPDERYLNWKIEESVSSNIDISNPRKPIVNPVGISGYDRFELDELTTQDQMTEELDKNFRVDFTIPLQNNFSKDIIKIGVRGRFKSKVRDNKLWEAEAVGDFSETMSDHPLKDYTLSNFQAGNYQSGSFTDKSYLGGLSLRDESLFELEEVLEAKAENFEAKENIIAGYAMINKNIGERFSFIAGARLENTTLDYQGYEFDEEGETVITTNSNDKYFDFLPALHLKYHLQENFILRAAWTNTIARPNYFDLVPYRLILGKDEELAEGNSKLKPTTSINLDFMAEKYFKRIGVVSGGVFFKNLKDIIYTYHQNNYNDNQSGVEFDEYNQPRNGGKASLFGMEVALQRQLDFLPGFLRGLGIYTNYTYTTSTANEMEGRENENLGLPGTAKHMFNASLSYESRKVTIRVSLNHTSDYLDEIGDSQYYDRFYDKQTFLDFNASYKFTRQINVFMEANNLTNQPLRYYQGEQSKLAQIEYYRPKFNFGVKFDLFGK